jgi:anti-anti-sigma factor
MAIADDRPRRMRPLPDAPFETPRIEYSALSEATTVITLRGDHDLFTKHRLLEALARARDVPNLIIDLTPCSFLDSSIAGVLLRACHTDRLPHQQAELVGPNGDGHVARVLAVSGIRDEIKVHPSLGHALQSAGEHTAAGSGA